jgi:hypothetical protein
MPVSMLVKCEKCGYENFPQHRFCGMCAAELRLPGPGGTQPVSAPVPRRVPAPAISPPKEREVVPQQAAGPSFLGLENERADAKSLSYLLEEEEPPSHRGRNLILILLLAAVAAAAWYWRQELRVVYDRLLSHPAPGATSSSSDNQELNSSATATSDSTSGAVPGNSASAGSQVEKSNSEATNSINDQAQTAPGAQPAGAADATQSPKTDQTQMPGPPQAGDSAAVPAPAQSDDSGEAASQPEPAPARKSSKVRTQPAATPAAQASELEAEGEKYLYGNGVPENCTRARTNLMAAAQHSNAQAQNVLGTMYATGHCATRDLPTAYRWFSRSLRKDPSNSRIEQDLKVLWNQMTPEERQVALRDTR